jgi:hypothetical protein
LDWDPNYLELSNCKKKITSAELKLTIKNIVENSRVTSKQTDCIIYYNKLDIPLVEYEKFFHSLVYYMTKYNELLGNFELSLPNPFENIEASVIIADMRRVIKFQNPERKGSLHERIQCEKKILEKKNILKEDNNDDCVVEKEIEEKDIKKNKYKDTCDYSTVPLRLVKYELREPKYCIVKEDEILNNWPDDNTFFFRVEVWVKFLIIILYI